jgi:fused signal recognition particle receptor
MNELELLIHNYTNIESGVFVDYISALSAAVIFIVVSLVSILKSNKKESIKLEKVAQTENIQEDKDELIEPVKPAPVVISFKERLSKGLSRTRGDIWNKVGLILKGSAVDDSAIEELEEILYTSDLSPSIVEELIDKLKNTSFSEDIDHKSLIKEFLRDKMKETQSNVNVDLYNPKLKPEGLKVIMIVGVNGAGKTTTIGKLATKLKSQGAKVVVGACDTFRAAAVEQLEVWCKRADVELIKAEDNANPTGVAFDTVKAAKEMNADYCIIDTAGRLHTASNLMDELAKTKKVMSKVIPDAPHETLLVIDAITGQNALRQAKEFNASLELSGLVFTKCDGSSKAGSAVSIVDELKVPIVYVGVGEDVEDLDIFNLDDFLTGLVGE